MFFVLRGLRCDIMMEELVINACPIGEGILKNILILMREHLKDWKFDKTPKVLSLFPDACEL